jgi:hypothetical protein
MASFSMFSNLPSINLDCEETMPYYIPAQHGWSPPDPQYMTRALHAFSLDPAMQAWNRSGTKDGQTFDLQDCHRPAPYPDVRQERSPWSYEPPELRSHVELVAPWASAGFPFVPVHPLSMGPDDGLASDQGSCSDGGTWSPVPSQRDGSWNGLTDERGECRVRPSLRPSSTFSTASLGGSSTSRSGITLQDVQQYPDSCPEEEFEGLVGPMGEEAPAYAMDFEAPARPPAHPDAAMLPPDAGYAHAGAEMAGDDETGPERDAGRPSGRAPATRRRSHAGRSSREIKHGRTPSHGTKRSPPADHAYRAGRVSKPSAKGGSAATTKATANSCDLCSHACPTKSALNKHVLTVHTRPFSCTFQAYGCPATFGSKNEWKRHVSSQHLRLGIWRCDMGGCLPQPPPGRGGVDADEDEDMLVHNDFNRKDLFTQHMRRMHAPAASCSAGERHAFNAGLEAASRRCLMDIRRPPPRSVCGYCPAGPPGHETAFEGPGSWESRMEHVGRHLESGHGVSKRWREDVGLRAWMVEEGLVEPVEHGRWRLVGLQVDDGKHGRGKGR